MKKIELNGALSVETEDFFEIEGEPDTYNGTFRSPLMFAGLVNDVCTLGTLELVIKMHFPNLFINNKPFPFKLIIEEM